VLRAYLALRLTCCSRTQEEVRAIAERDMQDQVGATAAPRGAAADRDADPSRPPPMADLQETCDEVRADIATTRSKLQQLRLSNTSGQPVFRRTTAL